MQLVSPGASKRARQLVYPVLYASLAVLIAVGIHRISATLPLYWSRGLMTDLAVWIGECGVVALIARFGSRNHAHLVFLAAFAAYFLIGAGVTPAAATALFLGSCYACGKLLLKAAFADEAEALGITRPLLVGLACELAFFGVIIHFPWNSGPRYLVVIGAPVLLYLWACRTKAFRSGLLQDVRARADALREMSPFWLFVLALMVMGFAARFAFFPAIDYDNNSTHLRIWTELTYRHRFPFDVAEQVFNVEPFAVDLARAIPSLVAGGDARGALALALYALILRQLWRISEAFPLHNRDRMLLLALFASTPMTGWLVNAFTADFFLAFLAVAGVRLIVETRAAGHRVDVVALLAVAALCASSKLTGVVLGVVLILTGVLALLLRRGRTPWLDPKRQWPILLFLLPFAVTALDSYVISWRITGNPLFPLYNGVFKSPYFPSANIVDQRWTRPLNLKNYVLMFFRTSLYGENQNFVAGFQYLCLLPLGLLALFRRLPLALALVISLPLVGYGLPMFSQTEYMRYMFPIAPLAILAIAALLLPGNVRSEEPSARLLVVLCIALNLFFYPGVSWLYSTGPQHAFNDKGKAKLVLDMNPVKAMVDDLNKEGNRDAVLFPTDSPFGAGLLAEPVYVNWYAPARQAAFAAIHSAPDAKAFLLHENIKHVIFDKTQAGAADAPAEYLRTYLDQSAVPVAELGSFTRYDLFDTAPIYRPMFDLRQLAAAKSDQIDLPPAAIAQLQTSDGLSVTEQPLAIAHAVTNWARIMRYHARFRCTAPGQFIAQVNWDRGPPYYRLVLCDTQFKDYEETVAIPAGALHATLYATVHGASGGVVADIAVETN